MPPGEYEFLITIIIGNKQETVPVTITLTDPCGDAQLTIGDNPFPTTIQTYVLGDPAQTIAYIPSELITSQPSIDCGATIIKFLSWDNTPIEN